MSCNPGQFSNDTINCYSCTANSYCQGGLLTKCPQYSVSPPGSSSISQCVCPPNAAITNGVCMCNDGYLISASGTQCTPCPAGSYCPDQSTAKNCSNNALSLPGQSSPLSCQFCPAGYVQNSATTSPISCRPCAVGSACPNATTETACNAGYYAPALATACLLCPANTYAPSASAACTSCSANSVSLSGSGSIAQCNCNAGYYRDPFYYTCVTCPAGQACVNNNFASCQPGTFSITMQPTCAECPAGTYQDQAKATACKTCPSGLTAQVTSVGTDLQSVIAGTVPAGLTSNRLFVMGGYNYPINANMLGANITAWSFWAAQDGCVVTPVIFGGLFTAPQPGQMPGSYTFRVMSVGTRRNASRGLNTFPYSDTAGPFAVPVANINLAAGASNQLTFFGWGFAGAACIASGVAQSPANQMYVWPLGAFDGTVAAGSVYQANGPFATTTPGYSVQLTWSLTQTLSSSQPMTTSIMNCTCSDGTRQLSNGLCQNKCPNGQYIANPGDTACSPCAQGSYCVNSIIAPCPIGTSSLPGATTCIPCVSPGQGSSVQLYTCGLLPTCTAQGQSKCCRANAPQLVDANGWYGLGTVVPAVGSAGGAVATPWLPGDVFLELRLNPVVDRPYALIQKDSDLSTIIGQTVAVQFYFMCAVAPCPDWMAVDYSQDLGASYAVVLNVTDFSSSVGAWLQIATSFFLVTTTSNPSNPAQLIPTRIRIYAQAALMSCTLRIGNVEIVETGYWQHTNPGGVTLLTTTNVLVPRFSTPNGYKEPVASTNLQLADNTMYVQIVTSDSIGVYPSYTYVASVYASGKGYLTLKINDADNKTWAVGSTPLQYTLYSTQTPNTFFVQASGPDNSITINGPSLTLRSSVVGCQQCLANYYCPTPVPVPCPTNSFSPPGSNDPTNCRCAAGYFGTPGVGPGTCAQCPIGFYCPGGTVPIVCPNGTITFAVGQSACVDCPVDDYCAFGHRGLCPMHATSPIDSHDVTQCICDPGYYGVAPSCKTCEPGFICLNGTRTACTQHATSPPLSSDASACYCVAGYYGVQNDTCTPCTEASYCAMGLLYSCPLNMWSPAMSALISNCTCDYGYYPVQAACSGCSPGSYKPSRGPSTCTACDLGKYSIGRAATTSSACISCSPGTYAVVAGQYQCQACAAGTYSSGLGSSFCTKCWAGAYSTLGSSVCTTCVNGTYSAVVAATSISTCQTCAAGAWAYANSTACVVCGACSYWKYPPAMHFLPGLIPNTKSIQITPVLASTQQHYAFATSSIDGTMYAAMGTALYKVDLTAGVLSPALNFQGPSTRAWWYASISASVLGNYLYAIQNQDVYRIDMNMGAYDIVYSSKLATCIVEDSTQPQTVLWIVQPTTIRQVDPIAAVDITGYTLSGGSYVCVNPQDPVTLFVVGTFGLKSLNKITGAFTTLKTGIAYTVCQVTQDGNFVIMMQNTPKVAVVFSLFDSSITNLVSASVSGIFTDGSNIVFGIDSIGVRNISYTYADSRNCQQGAYCESGGNPGPDSCTVCAFGNLCPGGPNVTSCMPGTYSNATGLREQAQCMICPAGAYCQGAVCTNPSDCSIDPSTGVCSGAACDATNNIQTCKPGTYSLSTGLRQPGDCPLCVAGFYCPNTYTQLPCPNNTWSIEGSSDLSACACAAGYQCIITKIVHAQVVLAMSYLAFTSNPAMQSKYISAVAAAAGVTTNQVSIQGIFSVNSPPSGRRLLEHRRGEWNPSAVDVHTLIHVSDLADLSSLNIHLRKRGLPPHRGVTVSLHEEVVQSFQLQPWN